MHTRYIPQNPETREFPTALVLAHKGGKQAGSTWSRSRSASCAAILIGEVSRSPARPLWHQVIFTLDGGIIRTSLPQRPQFPRPKMRRATRLQADQARFQAGKEIANPGAPQWAADHDLSLGVDGTHLKHVPGQIQAYCGNLHLGRLLSLVAFNTTTIWHFDAGEQGPSTPSLLFLSGAFVDVLKKNRWGPAVTQHGTQRQKTLRTQFSIST